ncbi:similar to S69204 pheromone response factor 1-smut fungus (Ustilago maydis) [Rhizoctonia solani AG-1 IB]|uniref:Similar to S69204 pheromone response factor 1-smut fungus (Ustilago maydis) n=1 Tax=Thanatephorus cucumeris (strain AG1-IB / isolate 7/3/14) TaxID=1108050 RepID=A0A0B7G0K2_THACB|nr:similar to S69204 pheromone response factor 1-smut fungus (Ustilago maydis) [Rhizoctonia solani AG-1 IB]
MPPSRRHNNNIHLTQYTHVPSSRKSVSFQVDHSPYISIDSFTQVYDGFPGASAISPASTASPLPVSPSRSPASIPLHTLGESEPSASSSTTAQVFDAFSWSAAITPHDYASAPQPYTPGHPANVAHREAMEREAYEGADPEDIDGGAGPSRKSSSSSRRRGSDTEEASDFGSGLPAGTSAAHARAIAQAAKPKSHARKMSAGHILRPRNAFIIFRSTMIKEGQITENMEKDHGNISTICGILWRKLSPTEKLKYQRMADLEKEEHRRANPGYKYAPKTRKEPPARRRQKKDQDIVARRCALAAALLAEGRRGSEMSRQLEHFDREVATQIKKEKEEAARLGIRTDPYAHAHSAKKLKRLERERKERERALALQASAVNLREGVLAMHAHAGILSAEKRRNAPPGPSNVNGPFSRVPRNARTPPGGGMNMPPPPAPGAAPAWTNPWASGPAPDVANMGRRPSSCPPPAAGNMAIPSLPTVPAVPVYNDYVSPTQPHAPHLIIEDMAQSSHPMNTPGPATAPLHHPQPQHNQGFSVPRRRSSSVPPPSLYAAPAQQYSSRGGNGWEPGARRPSVVFSMELERRPSQVQWNDDMGMGDARRPSIVGQSLGLGIGGWSRRPSTMLWTPQERRMSAQAPHVGSNNAWYSNGMNSTSHLDDVGEPRIDFGNFNFETTTSSSGGLTDQHLPPTAGPDQAYQFPPASGPTDMDMYPNMNPSPFGAILAQDQQMPMSHGNWQSSAPAMSPPTNGYSHGPHTPEADYSHPRYSQQPNNHYGVPNVRVHEPTWAAPINNDQSVPHTPIGSSPNTGVDEEGDMFEPFGDEVAFPELNSAPRATSEGRSAPSAYPPQQTKSLPPYSNSLPLGDILHENIMGGEDDLAAYSQGADNIALSGYDSNWKMLAQVDE